MFQKHFANSWTYSICRGLHLHFQDCCASTFITRNGLMETDAKSWSSLERIWTTKSFRSFLTNACYKMTRWRWGREGGWRNTTVWTKSGCLVLGSSESEHGSDSEYALRNLTVVIAHWAFQLSIGWEHYLPFLVVNVLVAFAHPSHQPKNSCLTNSYQIFVIFSTGQNLNSNFLLTKLRLYCKQNYPTSRRVLLLCHDHGIPSHPPAFKWWYIRNVKRYAVEKRGTLDWQQW